MDSSSETSNQEDALNRCRWFRINWKWCKMGRSSVGINIRLNPVVSFVSALIIWGFVAWCMIEPEAANKQMGIWKLWITRTFTWMYIGTQDAWAVFIIVLYFSKYGEMKLGKPDEKPEFKDASYFTMLFAAGIGIGLFYFGIAEPIWHYEPGHYGNRYFNRYSDNQRAQDSITITLFHWGIHGWVVYVVVGLLLAFVCYRQGRPMTMRSCMYPLIGDKIYGWMGDVIDIVSVVCTMFGVCTSLGLGVMQLNAGVHRLRDSIEISTLNQIIIIWCVTACATVSVISGLKMGIRRLSEICFALGVFIMLLVFFLDDPGHSLNLVVQSTGHYLQNVIQLGFHTDAFAQVGNAPDGKEAQNWMNEWTIFYWGWWIAWSPFVGMFIAKISRGRTIRQFINATLTAPVAFSILWFGIFGGAGLRMERNAALQNITCSSPLGGKNATESLNGLYRLSCRGKNDMWFDVMEQYGELGPVLSVLSLMGIVLYFVTSSDSGSLVIDCLSANGDPKPPVLQRVFWALTEGATATALLYVGGSEALTALQTVSVASGVPYTVMLCFMCVALWRAVKIEAGDLDVNGPQFTTGLLDVLSAPTTESVSKVLLSIFAPWYCMGVAAGELERSNGRKWTHMLILAIPFYTWIALLVLGGLVSGIGIVGWSVLFGFFAYATGIRISIREKYGISGNMTEDFFAVAMLFPFAAFQMEHHVRNHVTKDHGDRDPFVNVSVRLSSPERNAESCYIPMKEDKFSCDTNDRNTNV